MAPVSHLAGSKQVIYEQKPRGHYQKYMGLGWDYVGLYGIMWDYVGLYGIMWDFVGLCI